MKRILLTLAFCSPLLFSIPTVQSIDLIGPNGESQLANDQYGPISASETLWAISTKLKPDNSVSVYQTLVAIYKLNPTAFNKGNINGIIPNSVLNVPSVEYIAQQTNQEAYQLLKPTAKKVKKTTVIKKVAPVAPEKIKQVIQKSVDPEILDALKKEINDRDTALETSDKLISEQEKELLLVNEQLLVLTEQNQKLKLKLQPLSDQITLLSEDLENEIAVQKELQALIAEYKAQIDNFVEPPFSGDGLINDIFRTIGSSVTSILIAILSPLLLLAAIVVLLLRIKSKRELALQEQEMAESTAILMEQQSGKFDSLLTDDIQGDDNSSNDIDFANESDPDSLPKDVVSEAVPEELSDEIELDIIENPADIISLDDEVLPEVEEFEELVASEDDPFGIGALVEEEDLVVELDSEDNSEIELAATDDSDDVFDIDALIAGSDETIDLSDDDLSVSDESNQADLDLAAEWESQLASESEDQVAIDLSIEEEEAADELANIESLLETEADKSIDLSNSEESTELSDIDSLLESEPVVETAEDDAVDIDALLEAEPVVKEGEDEAVDIDALFEAESVVEEVEDEAVDIDALLEAEPVVEKVEKVEDEAVDIDALFETESVVEEVEDEAVDIDDLLEAQPVVEEVEDEAVDIDALLEAEPVVEEVKDEAVEIESSDESIEDLEALLTEESFALDKNSPSNEEITDLSEFENIDISSLKNVDEVISDLDAEEGVLSNDLLAKQLTETAFNEDVPLPSVDKNEDGDFIDIETLLEDTDNEEVIEDDFNLELGLDEFPDVVESFTEFDADASGVAAQLDLARAYLEIDEKNGAKEILTVLLETAKGDHLSEVKKLLSRVE